MFVVFFTPRFKGYSYCDEATGNVNRLKGAINNIFDFENGHFSENPGSVLDKNLGGDADSAAKPLHGTSEDDGLSGKLHHLPRDDIKSTLDLDLGKLQSSAGKESSKDVRTKHHRLQSLKKSLAPNKPFNLHKIPLNMNWKHLNIFSPKKTSSDVASSNEKRMPLAEESVDRSIIRQESSAFTPVEKKYETELGPDRRDIRYVSAELLCIYYHPLQSIRAFSNLKSKWQCININLKMNTHLGKKKQKRRWRKSVNFHL